MRDERGSAVYECHLARPPHPDVAHRDGAADCYSARRPGCGGNHAQLRSHPLGGSAFVGPRADGRGDARSRWRANHPPGRRPRRRGSASRPTAAVRRIARDGRTLRGHLATCGAGASLRAAQARHRRHSSFALHRGRNDDRRPGRLSRSRRARAAERPDRRRHQQWQDNARQCAAGRDRCHRRPRAGARRHGGTAMRCARPRSAAHAARRGVHDRAGALVHAPAA